MIAQVSGNVLSVGPTSCVIEVGGLGVRVWCSPNTAAELRAGQSATLTTSLIVREDALTLYGFTSAAERELFELLLTATGVGPKLAQAVLAVLSPEVLRHAIASENLVQLVKVPGIGRKGAQRMVIELKDKISTAGLTDDDQPASSDATPPWKEQVAQGLQGLGWSARDADTATAEVEHLAREDANVGVAVLMRAALQHLGRK